MICLWNLGSDLFAIVKIEIFFVDEGEVNVFINDKSKCLKAGEMSVTLSYDAHLYKSSGDSRSSLLIIPPHMCGDFITEDTDLGSRLLFYINANYKNDISLETISQATGYNPSYISRCFKETFGVGINKYINIVRLKNAVIFMREGKSTVAYCAPESGFHSMSSFYRIFYDEFGCTPTEFLAGKDGHG